VQTLDRRLEIRERLCLWHGTAGIGRAGISVPRSAPPHGGFDTEGKESAGSISYA